MENYPIAYIPHPVGSLNEDKLRALGWKPEEKFDDVLPNIVKYYKNNFIWQI